MKNYAIILAGGAGTRLGGPMPKQFISLNDKPVIVHTLENFEKNKDIEAVLIVCIKDFIQLLEEIIVEYELKKVKWIVPGGDTSHDSTRNGIFHLKDKIKSDDFVIIHDAARPILPQVAMQNMIGVAHEKGNASLAIPCYETVLFTEDQKSGIKDLDRNTIMRVQTPQMYRYDLILSSYEKAEADNLHDFVYADLVVLHYGERIYFSKGFTNNIKITRKEDVPLCKALMTFPEEDLFNL
jgi:2-C-methyl-D-erythritol 4-phosphate cytidylyltransferase